MIRDAELRDLNEIEILYENLFKDMSEMNSYYIKEAKQDVSFIKMAMNSEDYKLFVAEEDKKVVGFIVASISETNKFNCIVEHRFLYIIDLYVDKNYRGKKIATKLIDKAFTYAREKDLDHVELSVLSENAGAQKLYEKLGFRESSKMMYSIIDKE